MGSPLRANAIEIFESTLRKDYHYNLVRNIFPSINKSIENLLTRTQELADFYVEVYCVLVDEPRALETFVEVLHWTVYAWDSEIIKSARQDRDEIIDLNMRVADAAELLSVLISQRSDVYKRSIFSSDKLLHVVDAVRFAGEGDGHFESHLKDELSRLAFKFDTKCWPSVGTVMAAIGGDAQDAVTMMRAPSLYSSIESHRPGLTYVLNEFAAKLDECRVSRNGFIPNGFSVSDNSMASLVNCGLALEADDLIDGSFVKRFRQSKRNMEASLGKGA